jgi:hypothetical protein
LRVAMGSAISWMLEKGDAKSHSSFFKQRSSYRTGELQG